MNEKVYYPCYSSKLKDFLMDKGVKYLVRCRHYTTDAPMWIFMYDNKGLLDKYLEDWKSIRKIDYVED